MKVLVFALLALTATASAAPRDGNALAFAMKLILELIKLAIPEDAKLKLTDEEWTVPEYDYEKGKITVNEISLSGLKSFYYIVTPDTETHVTYSINIDDLVAVLDLSLNLTGILNFSDNVYVSIDLQTLQIANDLTFNEDQTEVTEYDMLVSVGGSDVKVEGVVSDEYSAQLTTELGEKVPVILNKIAIALEEPASDIVKYALNVILKMIKEVSSLIV